MRVISVINQKGGVGKTTTVLNLGHALALLGYKTALIDLDPQSHLTDSLGYHNYKLPGIDDVLKEKAKVLDVRKEVSTNLDLVPAGPRLSDFEATSRSYSQGKKLKGCLTPDLGYQVVLIDCPPSAGLLTMNALMASGEIIVPVSSDYLSLHGLSRLLSAISNVNGMLKLSLTKRIVITRYHAGRKLAAEVKEKLYSYFPGQVLNTVIRENVALAESPSFGKSIFDYRKGSTGAQDYLSLANDLLNSSGGNMMISSETLSENAGYACR